MGSINRAWWSLVDIVARTRICQENLLQRRVMERFPQKIEGVFLRIIEGLPQRVQDLFLRRIIDGSF